MPKDYIPAELLKHLNTPQVTLVQPYTYAVIVSARHKDDYARAWETDKGVFFDISRTALLYQGIKDFSPLTDTQKAEISTLPDAYQQVLLQANKQLLQTIENNKKKSGFTINEAGQIANEDLFASIISKFRGKVLLVDFWATWCGPCRMQAPILDQLAEEVHEDDLKICKMDVDENPNTARQFGIMSIPTLLFKKDGQVVKQVAGVHTKAQLKEIIEELS